MVLVITALLAVLTFVFVGYPLLRPRRAEPSLDVEAAELEELMAKRDETLAAIKELEFDYESGSLSPEDFKEMEERYRERAIAILKDIDQWQAGETAEDAIERQVSALRQAQDTALRQAQAGRPVGEAEIEDLIERQVREMRQGRPAAVGPVEAATATFCYNCGTRLREEARFCPNCGASLTQRRCSQCGSPLEPEDRFCAQCGTPAPGAS